jgi:hypothetical protein
MVHLMGESEKIQGKGARDGVHDRYWPESGDCVLPREEFMDMVLKTWVMPKFILEFYRWLLPKFLSSRHIGAVFCYSFLGGSSCSSVSLFFQALDCSSGIANAFNLLHGAVIRSSTFTSQTFRFVQVLADREKSVPDSTSRGAEGGSGSVELAA